MSELIIIAMAFGIVGFSIQLLLWIIIQKVKNFFFYTMYAIIALVGSLVTGTWMILEVATKLKEFVP